MGNYPGYYMNFFDYSCLTDKIQKVIYNFWLFLNGILPIYMSKKLTLRASHLGHTCCVAGRSR